MTKKKPSQSRRHRSKSASPHPRRRLKALITTSVIVALTIIGAFVAYRTVMRPHSGPQVWIHIPGGSSSNAVIDSIVAALGDDEGAQVANIWGLIGGRPGVSRGAYLVKPGTPVWRAAYNISRGRQTPVRVSFNSVRTIDQMAADISENLEFSPDDFLAACDKILPSMNFDEASYMAAFLPDTYEFYWGTQPEAVVQKLMKHYDDFWNTSRKDKAKALGLTPVQVVTIASIIEEESAKTDERPKIARLYLNRLKEKMPLQADPTVKYALGDFSIKRITNDMLRTPSPYNTYRQTGLPPGPIRIPDPKSIDAVLDAPEHNYIYMCAKEDFSGYHNFAVDYNTHMANARRYQAELDRRNIH